MKILMILCVFMGFGRLEASKILGIFAFPVRSHYILGESLLRGLAEKGHHVTMMSAFELETPRTNYSHVKLEGTEELMKAHSSKLLNVHISTWEKIKLGVQMWESLNQIVHNNTNVKEFVLKKEKYDLCIVSFGMMEAMFAVCDAVKAPSVGFSIIGLSSMITYPTSNPVTYAYVPNPTFGLTENMTFMERVLNTLGWIFLDVLNKFLLMPHQGSLVQQFYPNAPPLEELLDNVDLYFLNSHIATDSPKALLPNIIPIGGYHLQIMDTIPKDLKLFLDTSKKGVIYFNLGTGAKASDLGDNITQTLVNTFAKLEYDILWQYDGVLANKPKNVRTETWVPQRSVLMHPKIKIFMTHGGLGGTVEAIYGGVPMVCMPIVGDQLKNCAESVHQGYAIILQLSSISEELLLETVGELERNPKYKEKIMLKSDVYRNQEVNPMNKAIFWAEHVIKHKGANHLKSKATSLQWYQYYLIDIIGFLGFMVIFIGFLLKLLVKITWRVLYHSLTSCIGIFYKQKVKTQ